MASNDTLLSLQCNTSRPNRTVWRIKDTWELGRDGEKIKKKLLSVHSSECHLKIEKSAHLQSYFTGHIYELTHSSLSLPCCFYSPLLMYEFSHTHTHTRLLNCQLNLKITLASPKCQSSIKKGCLDDYILIILAPF